jgi:hypothetical protein
MFYDKLIQRVHTVLSQGRDRVIPVALMLKKELTGAHQYFISDEFRRNLKKEHIKHPEDLSIQLPFDNLFLNYETPVKTKRPIKQLIHANVELFDAYLWRQSQTRNNPQKRVRGVSIHRVNTGIAIRVYTGHNLGKNYTYFFSKNESRVFWRVNCPAISYGGMGSDQPSINFHNCEYGERMERGITVPAKHLVPARDSGYTPDEMDHFNDEMNRLLTGETPVLAVGDDFESEAPDTLELGDTTISLGEPPGCFTALDGNHRRCDMFDPVMPIIREVLNILHTLTSSRVAYDVRKVKDPLRRKLKRRGVKIPNPDVPKLIVHRVERAKPRTVALPVYDGPGLEEPCESVQFNHQWPVAGHWRQFTRCDRCHAHIKIQFRYLDDCPSCLRPLALEVYKRVWQPDHIRGPESAPLVDSEHIVEG